MLYLPSFHDTIYPVNHLFIIFKNALRAVKVYCTVMTVELWLFKVTSFIYLQQTTIEKKTVVLLYVHNYALNNVLSVCFCLLYYS